MINQFGFSSPSKPWNDSTPHAFLHRMQISRLKERFLKFSKTEQKLHILVCQLVCQKLKKLLSNRTLSKNLALGMKGVHHKVF